MTSRRYLIAEVRSLVLFADICLRFASIEGDLDEVLDRNVNDLSLTNSKTPKKLDRAHSPHPPTTPPPIQFFFGNQSLTWTDHSNHTGMPTTFVHQPLVVYLCVSECICVSPLLLGAWWMADYETFTGMAGTILPTMLTFIKWPNDSLVTQQIHPSVTLVNWPYQPKHSPSNNQQLLAMYIQAEYTWYTTPKY